jgi:hypothetical protein
MKYVTIVVPDCELNLNSIAGAYEILSRANDYWQKIGNKPRLKIQIAGFVAESSVNEGYFTVHPLTLMRLKKLT